MSAASGCMVKAPCAGCNSVKMDVMMASVRAIAIVTSRSEKPALRRSTSGHRADEADDMRGAGLRGGCVAGVGPARVGDQHVEHQRGRTPRQPLDGPAATVDRR